jgi:hypothetical protein
MDRKPCMHYGVPCEVGTEGDCVCRKRFFSSPRPLAQVVRETEEAQLLASQSDAWEDHGKR